jgi:membrane-associated phospholipid phosphatase
MMVSTQQKTGLNAIRLKGDRGSGERLFFLKATVFLYAAWVLIFELVGHVAESLPTTDLTLSLDRRIPFIAWFVWPYVFCHIWPFLPFVTLKDWHQFNKAFLAILLANLTAYVVYILIPVAFPRPELGTSLSDRVLAWYYQLDFYPGANKLPSLHVAFIWITAIACRKQRLGRVGDGLVLLGAALITVSTLFVKQHILLDVVLGMAWGFAAWFAARRLYPLLVGPVGEPAGALKRLLRKTAPAALLYVVIVVLVAAFVLRRPV